MPGRVSLPIVIFALLCSLACPAFAASPDVADASSGGSGITIGDAPPNKPEVHVQLHMISDVKAIQAGKPFKVGVELMMDPGWHTYYKQSGDAGMPTSIQWKLPPGFKAGELLWEKPFKFNDAGIITYGYHTQTMIAAEITPPSDLKVGDTLTFEADVKWLSCKDVCLPGKGKTSLSLPVGDPAAAVQPDNDAAFGKVNFNGDMSTVTEPLTSVAPTAVPSSPAVNGASATATAPSILDEKFNFAKGESTQSLFSCIVAAFIGGFILNFMPCVLPVIAIKIFSFLEQAHDEPRRVRLLGLTFSAGIISSFMLLAAIVLGIQAAGNKVGWGFQFQYPGFVIGMSVVVLLFALSLFGLFYIQVNAGQAQLDKLANKEGYAGTFFKGVLATVLSTPCTAPFLGTALGFAFSQSPLTVAMIFFTIGLGMCSPYLLFSARPDLMKFAPKPGVWMEKLKESLGFILLATDVWLMWVLGAQVGVEAVVWNLAFLVAIAFAAWLIARFTDLTSSNQRKYTVWGIAAVITVAAFYFFICVEFAEAAKRASIAAAPTSADGITWEPLDLKKLTDDVNGGKTVFLDFTAQWCLTCKVNENTVLATAPVVEKMKALHVVTMRADWTSQDANITKLLNKFNRSGVPLYVIFPAGKASDPIVLPEVITQGIVLDDLDKAGPSR
jgi:thiol:disulfide interchange protein DsbD